MARSHMRVYFDFDERTAELNETERGRLLLAMLRYAKTGEVQALTGNEKYLFPIFKADLDRDKANYDTKLKNGLNGGRPKETGENRNKPKTTENNRTETEDNRKEPKETEDNRPFKNKNKNKKEDDHPPIIPLPFAADSELIAQQREEDEVLSAMEDAGIPNTTWNRSRMTDLRSRFDKDRIIHALGEAARCNKLSLAYVEGVLNGNGKKPDDDGLEKYEGWA